MLVTTGAASISLFGSAVIFGLYENTIECFSLDHLLLDGK